MRRRSPRPTRSISWKAAGTRAVALDEDAEHPAAAINTWTEAAGHGEIKAIDPRTGDIKWAFKMHDVTDAGILTTASDVLFAGNREGYFMGLDARDGTVLWRALVSGQISSSPISYGVDGKQYVAISAYHAVFAFGLR